VPEPAAEVAPPAPESAPVDVPLTPPSADAFGGAMLHDGSAIGDPVVISASPSPAAATAASGSPADVYALVIGINDYPGSEFDLHSAVADANDMVAALAKLKVPSTNVLELTDAAATAQDIVAGIRWLTQVAGPDSTAVVYYAGHVRKLAPTTEAIVASDGVAIADWYLARRLAPLQARDTWIVFASCYGGGFDELLAPGRILTAAADANGLAYESASFGRSYLDEYLVRRGLLLGEAGGPTVQQAFAWAQAMLQRDAPDRTLTQLDSSTEPISLDGVHRSTVPPVSTLSPAYGPPTGGNDGGGTGGGQPPATTPPPPPPPCKNLLGLLCPSQ